MGLRDWFGLKRDAMPALPAADDSVVRTDEEPMVHNDVWSNPRTGLGGRNSRSACNVFGFEAPRDITELDNLYEFNALAARMIDREPDDCVRKGFTIKGLDAAEQEDLDERLGQLEFLSKLSDAHRWARVFGGACMYVQLDDGLDRSEPVNFTRIKSVNGLTVYDRHEAVPLLFDVNPESPTTKLPIVFQISSEGFTFQVHRSRLLLFDGVRLTPRRRRERLGWGGSWLGQVWKALEQHDVAHAYLNEAITQLTQGVLKLANLNVAMKKGNARLLASRIHGLKQAMSVLGDIALDANDNESYEVHQRSVTGYKEASEIFIELLVASSGIPKSILLGKTPGGLNSGDNAGDWTTWNTFIGGRQTELYTPRVLWFLRMLLSAADAPVSVETPSRLNVVWGRLQEQSDNEKATQLGQVATAGNTLIIAGALSSDEVRGHRLVREEFDLNTEEEFEEEGEEAPGRPELVVADPEPDDGEGEVIVPEPEAA